MDIDPRLRAGPLVFVGDLDDPALRSEDEHHLRRSRRLRSGARLVAADGAGRWRPVRLAGTDRLEPDGEIEGGPRPSPLVRIAFAPVKGERTEWAVAKLTEVGADEITLLGTTRSVVRWEGERAGRHNERLRRVAREAAMQSRRIWLPVVRILPGLEDLLAGHPPTGVWRAADPSGEELPQLPTGVVIGPEGGLTGDELAALGPPVRLGPQVLRTETAALVAGALLAAGR